MITLGQGLQIDMTYDDGGGNAGIYSEIIALGTWDYHRISEQKFYRPKIMSLLPPLSEDSWSISLDSTTSGSPPATLTVAIQDDGQLTWTCTDSYITYVRFRYTVKVISIDLDAVFVVNNQTITLITPEDNSVEGRMALYDGSAYVVGTSNTWATAENWDDQDLDADHFNATNDYYTYHLWYDMSVIEESFRPNVQHCVLVLTDTDLLTTDWSTGKLIEQGVEALLAVSGLMDGSFGPLIGSVLEFQRDGEFGDLDLPVEYFERRWSRT